MNIRALVIAGLVTLGTAFTAHAQNYVIARSVIAAGATPMASGSYVVDGTIGQTVIGISSSGTYNNEQGFWYTLVSPLGVRTDYNGEANGFALGQNYPNPFNPSTNIEFSVPERCKVTIRVMNLLGEEVHTPLVNEEKDLGSYKIEFNDADNLPSGTYIYRMDATPANGGATFTASKRMVLLK